MHNFHAAHWAAATPLIYFYCVRCAFTFECAECACAARTHSHFFLMSISHYCFALFKASSKDNSAHIIKCYLMLFLCVRIFRMHCILRAKKYNGISNRLKRNWINRIVWPRSIWFTDASSQQFLVRCGKHKCTSKIDVLIKSWTFWK